MKYLRYFKLLSLSFSFLFFTAPVKANAQVMILSEKSIMINSKDIVQPLADYALTRTCNGNTTLTDIGGFKNDYPYKMYITISYNPNTGLVTGMGWESESVAVDLLGIGFSYTYVNAMASGYPRKSGNSAYFKPVVYCFSVGSGGVFAKGVGGEWKISSPGPLRL